MSESARLHDNVQMRAFTSGLNANNEHDRKGILGVKCGRNDCHINCDSDCNDGYGDNHYDDNDNNSTAARWLRPVFTVVMVIIIIQSL